MPEPDTRPVNVLVSDEAKLVRLLIADLVNDGPFAATVTEVGDGTEACRHLLSGRFDIAVLSDDVAGINGLSALELAHRMGSKTLVVILSADPDEQKVARASEHRAYDLLKQPFEPEQFNRVLTNYQRMRQPCRTLIVDDSPVIRNIVKKLCDRSLFNLDLEEASDGKRAVDACRDRQPELMFLDIVMPEMSGPEALYHIRKFDKQINVILMTADQKFQISENLAKLKPETVLRKPFTNEDIDRCLHDAFGLDRPALDQAGAGQKTRAII